MQPSLPNVERRIRELSSLPRITQLAVTETVRATRESGGPEDGGPTSSTAPLPGGKVAVRHGDEKGDVQHSGVLVEGLLGAVAMVKRLWREMGSELRAGLKAEDGGWTGWKGLQVSDHCEGGV